MSALLMAVLPISTAAGLTVALLRNNDWAAGLFGVFFGGLLVLAVGLLFRNRLPGRSALAWRLLGWSAAASVLLIPASTVLLAWFGGVLAFLILWPEGWLKDETQRVQGVTEGPLPPARPASY